MIERQDTKAVEVRQEFPVDLLVELVEARYAQRLRTTIRWWISAMVGTMALAVTITGILLNQFSEDTASTTDLKNAFEAHSVSVLTSLGRIANEASTPSALDSVQVVGQRLDQSVELGQDGISDLRFRAESSGGFVIRAAGEDGIDPVIELYVVNDSTEQDDLLGSNDDDGWTLDSRLEIQLDSLTIYELRVREFFGRVGRVDVSITPTGSALAPV